MNPTLKRFLEHVLALVLGAATPFLTRVADVGVTALTRHDVDVLWQAELAALVLAFLAWSTPIVRLYGAGSPPPVDTGAVAPQAAVVPVVATPANLTAAAPQTTAQPPAGQPPAAAVIGPTWVPDTA